MIAVENGSDDRARLSQDEVRACPFIFAATGVSAVPGFELACSLEVADLPASLAEQFVDNLVSLAPVVRFSAAIPHQGGIQHVNEQWQSFWSHLFERRGHTTIDYLRPRIWTDKRVEWWYRQNIMVYANSAALAQNQRLYAMREMSKSALVDIVHPEAYLEKIPVPDHFSGTVKKLPGLFAEAIRKRMP